MNFEVIYTDYFLKETKYLSKKFHSFKHDLLSLVTSLEENPTQGTSLGNNLYKIRLAIKEKGKGKRGGARIITYVLIKQNTVYLTYVYDKSEKENVDIQFLLQILKEEGLV